MKIINKAKKFISAIRWYMSDNVDNRPDFYHAFANEHKDEFEEFADNLRLNEIKESFKFFNKYFRDSEAAIIVRSMNNHEGLYRNRNSCSSLSHGELTYKPYFRCEQSPRYLGLYFYLIALNMYDVDFYPYNKGYDDTDELFTPESMRFEPLYFGLIKGRYSVTSDYKVNIN